MHKKNQQQWLHFVYCILEGGITLSRSIQLDNDKNIGIPSAT